MPILNKQQCIRVIHQVATLLLLSSAVLDPRLGHTMNHSPEWLSIFNFPDALFLIGPWRYTIKP